MESVIKVKENYEIQGKEDKQLSCYELSLLSCDAYLDKVTEEEWRKLTNIKLKRLGDCIEIGFFNIKKTDTQAFLFRLGNYRYLIFRGTEQPLDHITDANVKYENFGLNSYHSGFGRAFFSVLPEIKEYLKDKEPLALVCSGHSLAGTLAGIAAIELKGVSILRTFGAPPFSRGASITNNIVDSIHYVNDGDSVSRSMKIGNFLSRKVLIPLLEFLISRYGDKFTIFKDAHTWLTVASKDMSKYKHEGAICILKPDGTRTMIENLIDSEPSFREIFNKEPKRGLLDHKMEEYSKRLKA